VYGRLKGMMSTKHPSISDTSRVVPAEAPLAELTASYAETMPRLDRIHHVGVACRDIEQMRAWVIASHVITHDSGIVHDPRQRADLCILSVDGGPAIELVSGEMVAGVVRRGQTYYHLCYEVVEIASAIVDLEATGCRTVSPPTPAVLFGGRHVAFVLGPMGLVELLEV